MLNVVDAIEAKHMKGITIDVGQGVKAKVSKNGERKHKGGEVRDFQENL